MIEFELKVPGSAFDNQQSVPAPMMPFLRLLTLAWQCQVEVITLQLGTDRRNVRVLAFTT